MYKKHRKHHQCRLEKRDLVSAVLKIGSIVLILAAVYFVMNVWEKKTYQVEKSTVQVQKEEQTAKTVTIDGQKRKHLENIETYLFLGIDKQGQMTGIDGYYGGGQADVQMVFVLDHDNQTWQILQLNRDTMAEVPILGMQGDVIGKEYEQIALSYSYGDGAKGSCENSVRTVSELLWGEEIHGYYALNMDGIVIINDMLGGVNVTVTSDFSEVDETLTIGENITLQGEQALTFIRTRKDVDDQTNVSRMARQRQYLDALGKELVKLEEEDILQIYDAVFDYTVTDMGSKTITNLAKYAEKYRQLDILTIDGNQVIEGEHWAYYLDKEDLQDTILQMFYEPLQQQ